MSLPSPSSSMPVYFELSWAILSSIGLANVLFGLTVAGISGFPLIVLVPLIVSAASAVANGLCYYAFYTDNPVMNMAVASAFADLTWLVREGAKPRQEMPAANFANILYLFIDIDSRSRALLLQLCDSDKGPRTTQPNHLHVDLLGPYRRHLVSACSHSHHQGQVCLGRLASIRGATNYQPAPCWLFRNHRYN